MTDEEGPDLPKCSPNPLSLDEGPFRCHELAFIATLEFVFEGAN
jgi:hypothetical protein